MKIKYVCGFCFNYDRTKVALIKKVRPKWQSGLLNGIGGHVEEGEDIFKAMQREFLEEAGAEILAWNLFCTYNGDDYIVFFMKAFSSEIDNVKTMTDEEVIVYDIIELNEIHPNVANIVFETIPNLKWLIPLALDINVDKTECRDYKK